MKTEKKENSPGNTIGVPKGLRFDRSNSKTELTTSDEALIIKWRDALRNKINQRGFHELFKAHKKIGKGNFASVNIKGCFYLRIVIHSFRGIADELGVSH